MAISRNRVAWRARRSAIRRLMHNRTLVRARIHRLIERVDERIDKELEELLREKDADKQELDHQREAKRLEE